MKKIFALLLVVVMCFSLVACGEKDQTKIEVNGEKISVSLHGECVLLSEEQMMSYAKVVELTTENWTDYLSVQTSGKDTIIEVTAAGEFPFVWLNDTDCKHNKVEFKDKKTGKIHSVTIGLEFPVEKRTVEELDLEFVSSESKLVLFDIPEEFWRADYNGNDSVYFGTKTQAGAVSTLYGGQVFKDRIVLLGYETIEEMLKSLK